MSDGLEDRITSLEQTIAHLLTERPGRKPKPVLVSELGVCGLDPDCDSAECTSSSLYRRQKGCLGDACRTKSATYYQHYRANERRLKKNLMEVTISVEGD
jgi:hypothetical protein